MAAPAQKPAPAPEAAPQLVQMNPLFGPYGEPSVGIIAGPPGTGKTTALLFSFAGLGLFGALPGALKASVEDVGWSPAAHGREIRLTTIPELTHLFRYIEKIKKEGAKSKQEELLRDVLVLVGDDISVLMSNTKDVIDKAPKYTKNGGVDVFDAWDRVKAAWGDMVSAARAASVHAWFSAHLALPETDATGNLLKGGPKMPSKGLVASTPYLADVIWITAPSPWAGNGVSWKHAALCENGSALYHTKDRHGWEGIIPLNPAESLRAVGYKLARPKGQEWQEDVADLVASEIAKGNDPLAVCKVIGGALVAKGLDRRLVRWAVHRDGVDRWRFQATRAARWAALGL